MDIEKEQFKDMKNSLFQLNEQVDADADEPQQMIEDSNLCQLLKLDTENEIILLAQKNFYKKNKWAKQMIETRFQIEFQSAVELHYGPYAIKINVVNLVYQFNPQMDQNYIGCGQFGNVYACEFNGTFCAVKMIKLDEYNFFTSLKKVYKQYFLALMASELKVGPKINNLFGYDIVFMKNCAMFGMELCESLGKNHSKQTMTQLMQQLKNSLTILHSLHVVHRDIKPENIAWSINYQRYVFIDYGVSLIIRQIPGQRTRTAFAGSYSYCSPEMRKCFILKGDAEVEMYNNDLHAFSKCQKTYLNDLFQNSIFSMVSHKKEEESFIRSLSFITRIMHKIYSKQYDQIFSSAQFCLKLDLMKSFLSIIENIIEKFSMMLSEQMQYEKLITLKKKLKEKIIERKFNLSKFDFTIAGALDKTYTQKFNFNILFTEKYLQQINKWSIHEKLLQRIFYYLIDSSENQNSISILYSNIYRALNKPPTYIFIKVVRTVLLFFFQKFKKFHKKTQIFNFLSDILSQIGDQLSVQRIRDFIMQLTEDPIQYLLQGLKFHMLDVHCHLSHKINFHGYLKNVKERISKFEDNKNFITIENLVLKIISNFERVKWVYKQDLKILQQIGISLLQIEKLIQSEKIEIKKVFQRIKQRYGQQKIKFLFNQINSKQLSEYLQPHNIHEKKILQSQLCGYIIKKNNYNLRFYSQIHKKFNLSFLSKISYKRYESLQFYFQMTHGYVLAFKSTLQFLQFRLILNNQSNLYLLLKFHTQWIQIEQGQKLKSYAGLYQQIICCLNNLLHAILIKNKKKQFDEQHYFVLLAIFQKTIIKIKNFITDEIQAKKLYLVATMVVLAYKYYFKSFSSEEIFHEIYSIFKMVIFYDKNYKDKHKQFSMSCAFMPVLSVLCQTNYFSNQKSQRLIQKIMIDIFNFSLRTTFMINIPFYLKIVVQILAKNNKHEENFEIIQNCILFNRKKRLLNDIQFREQNNIQLTSYTFCQVTPQPILQNFLQRLISKEQKQKLDKILDHPEGCLFLTHLLIKSRNIYQLYKSCFIKISKHLNKKDFGRKSKFIIQYYLIFVKWKKINVRKKTIMYRQIQKQSIIEIHLKYTRIFRYAVENYLIKEWPKLMGEKLKEKLQLTSAF